MSLAAQTGPQAGVRGWIGRTVRPGDRVAGAHTAAVFTYVGAGLLALKNLAAYLLYGSTEPSGIPTSTTGFVLGTIAVPCLLVAVAWLFPKPWVVGSWVVALPGSLATVAVVVAMLVGFDDHSAGSQLFLVFPVVWAAYYLRPVACAVSVTASLSGIVLLAWTAGGEVAWGSVVYLAMTVVLVALMIARRRQGTAATAAALVRQITSDVLTGLATRPVLDAVGAQLIARPAAVALIVFDIDHFKAVNDGYGHLAGDAVLRHLAGEIARAAGVHDVASRLGGDEFALLVADADADRAMSVAQTIVGEVRGAPVRTPEGAEISYTVSVGVATVTATVRDVEALYSAADRALYRAKAAGRDRAAAAE